MFKRMVAGAAVLGLWAVLAQPAAAQSKKQVLVVFDFSSAGAEGAGLDPVALAQTVRSAAASAAPDVAVMERGPMAKLLNGELVPPTGCTGPCEVASGKLLGADLALSGALTRTETTTTLVLKLYAVATGAAVGTETVSVKKARNLESNLPRVTGLLLARLSGKPAPAAAPAAAPAPVASAQAAPPAPAPQAAPIPAAAPVAPAAPAAPAPASRAPLASSRAAPEIPPLPALLQPHASFPADTNPDVLVARDLALAADDRGTASPAEAQKAWKALGDAPGLNPFKDAALGRARQWADFRAQKEAFDRQKDDDKASVRKVLPLRSVADSVKAELLLRFARLYGAAEARELLPSIDQASARASAEAALACEAKDGQACVPLARAAAEAGDKARARELWEKGCAAGAPEACEELGTALADAEGAGRDLARATAALKLACDAGRGRACSKLATAAVVGKEGAPDPALLEKGCVAGDGQSCMRLGLMTENGKLPGDDARATAFFRLGCKFNNAGACSKFNYYQQRAEAEASARAREEESARQRQEAAQEKAARDAEARSSRRTVGLIVAAGGLAAGAGAGLFLYLGASNNDDVRNGQFATGADLQSAIDSGKTYNLAAMVAGGLGAAALATGAIIFLLNPTPDTKVAVLPNGLSFAARFP